VNDEFLKMVDLSKKGFYCSQILVIMALEAQEKSNKDVVRAMSGLICGIGSCGKLCGALTGGACVLGLYAGKGAAGEKVDERLDLMLHELVEWFESTYTERFGSTDCSGILQDDMRNRITRCPGIVMETWEKIQEILSVHGYSISDDRDLDESGAQ
jgi:C_GCAxxG_C_C family probable redox protein